MAGAYHYFCILIISLIVHIPVPQCRHNGKQCGAQFADLLFGYWQDAVPEHHQ